MSDTPDYTDDGLIYYPNGPDDQFVEPAEPNIWKDDDGVVHVKVDDLSETTKYLFVENKVLVEDIPF